MKMSNEDFDKFYRDREAPVLYAIYWKVKPGVYEAGKKADP